MKKKQVKKSFPHYPLCEMGILFIVFLVSACVPFVAPSLPPTEVSAREAGIEEGIVVDTQPETGSIFYVDINNGSNFNSGTQAKPWKTIQRAANAMPAGSAAVILAGNYPERVTVDRSSQSFFAQGSVTSQGFVIKADYVSVSGFTITSFADSVSTGVGIDVLDATYCLISNNNFFFNTWGGIRLQESSSNCQIRGNTFFRNAMFAAEVMGQNHLIKNNGVSHTIQHHPCSNSTASWLDADAFRFHGSGHIFRNNRIHDMPYGPEGFDLATCSIENLADLNKDFVSDSHTDCFQTYGDEEHVAGHDILFDGNRCELPRASQWADGTGAKAFQVSGNAYNLTFSNNLVVADMLSYFEDGCHDLMIVHNTFVGSGDTHSQGLQFENCAGNIQIKNNIFYKQENGIGYIWPVNTPVDAGYNCIYREQGSPSRPADIGDVWDMDPRLDSSYHLLENSPCIDVGVNLGIATDFDGNPRPQGMGFDMGAFEYSAP